MIHQVVSILVVMMLSMALSGCGTVDQPFAKSEKSLLETPGAHKAPTVTIVAINGVPQEKSNIIGNALERAAARRGIPVSHKRVAGGMTMTGDFIAQNDPLGRKQLLYGWTLRDSRGTIIHQISGVEAAGDGKNGTWASVDPIAWKRIADHSAESLSSRLSQLGYNTQTRAIAPPQDTFARAGPNAESEIDHETLNGPRTASLPPPIAKLPGQPVAAPPAVKPVVRDKAKPDAQKKVASRSQPELPAAKAGKPEKKAPTKKGPTIKTVAVTNVTGSPGRGNQELASAMRRVLQKAGWPITSKPGRDTLRIAARVKLAPPAGGTQKVSLAWIVKLPDGSEAGTVRQNNAVPPGSLDTGWGKNAEYAAQAAAGGIAKLVDKLR